MLCAVCNDQRRRPKKAPTWTVSLTFRRLECGSVQMKFASTSLSCSGSHDVSAAVRVHYA